MKIAIITIIDYINYGNRLQNYAIQKFLEEQGHDVETIVATSYKRELVNRIKKTTYSIYPSFFETKRSYILRESPFICFTKQYIKERKVLSFNGRIPKWINRNYDFFIVGSDQIWNPEFINYDVPNGGIYNRLLQFVEPQKRIALAPSFGVEKIPFSLADNFKEELLKFHALSVREDAGADIIKKLIDKDIDILIDPTLMFEAKTWHSISKSVDAVDCEHYILKFIISHETNEYKKKVDAIAKDRNLKIKTMLSESDKSLFVADPSQFIFLISNADLVCTDSFHAIVFSIIFNKPFLLMDRNDGLSSMNSRIETLLHKLNLKDKMSTNSECIDVFNYDYSYANTIIEKEREHFKQFILNALGL